MSHRQTTRPIPSLPTLTAVLAVLAVLACASAAPQPAHAALGAAPASAGPGAEPAAAATRAVARRVLARSGFQVHETTLDSGTVLREFTGAGGTVFAVAWQGPMQPNLRLLLGNYFPRLLEAGQAPGRQHGRLSVRESDLVIESAGRMRGFAGLAYLPSSLPAGVTLEDLK